MQLVSDTVREYGAKTQGYASMGATTAGLVFRADTAIVFNVGDCSVLRIKDGYVGQLALIDRQTREGGRRGVVTQALGGTAQPMAIDAHADVFIPDQSELLVVCTDGLTDCVDSGVIAELAVASSCPAELADQLVASA